jgi:hypothetical protein
MKHLQGIAVFLIIAALLLPSVAALAQQGTDAPLAGLTVTSGDWILRFTRITDDKGAISKRETKDFKLKAGKGKKLVWLAMDVLASGGRLNIDDLDVKFTGKDGAEYEYSMSSYQVKFSGTVESAVIEKLDLFVEVPKALTFDDLTLRVLAAGHQEYVCPLAEAAAAVKAANPEPLDTVTSGDLTLTMKEPGSFEKLKGNPSVSTRLGDTHLLGGATAWPGSSLLMDTMKNTQEYGMLLVPFSYKVGKKLGKDAVADLLGELGGATPLEYDGQKVAAKTVWITDKLCAFVYDLSALKGVPLSFYQNGDALMIRPAPDAQ